jgi:predicted PolB exonuclease-like 3'-5' exonuclease
MAGIPGKYDVSGDQVFALFYQGEVEKIREYCQSDVLNTYWLYLKYELLKGALALEDYYRFLTAMRQKLPKRGYYDIFVEAIDSEIARQ